MKKTILALTLLTGLLFSAQLFAQSPKKFNYQAVCRDSLGNIIDGQPVLLRLTIHDLTPTGAVLYKETHNTTTNDFGLVTLAVGGGTVVTGTFLTIPWGSGNKYLEVELDAGSGYSSVGTSQLLSVPYALYAQNANAHYIGESYGGGIVFYVYDGGQHGLIAATADQDTSIEWRNNILKLTGTKGDGLLAGLMNTALIVAAQVPDNPGQAFAASLCADYSVSVGGITYGDWYLPSKYELNLLYLQKAVVGNLALTQYWSSTEYDYQNAWIQYFGDGTQFYSSKMSSIGVRAIRAF